MPDIADRHARLWGARLRILIAKPGHFAPPQRPRTKRDQRKVVGPRLDRLNLRVALANRSVERLPPGAVGADALDPENRRGGLLGRRLAIIHTGPTPCGRLFQSPTSDDCV